MGWLVLSDFTACRVRFGYDKDQVVLFPLSDGCCGTAEFGLCPPVLPRSIVRVVASARELCERSEDPWPPQAVILEGVIDVARHYATLGRPLAGWCEWARILYGTAEQHADMVCDASRTDFFQGMIARHCAGRRVLEVGVGSGVLLVFAARAGASRVDGLEIVPEAAALARETLRRNNLDTTVRLHEVAAEEFVPPADAANEASCKAEWDVLVSEAIGLMGFCEWMVMSVLVARRWLAPLGRILPACITLFACPVLASFAHAPHGADMSHIVPPVLTPFRVPRHALLALEGNAEGKEIARLDWRGPRPPCRSPPFAFGLSSHVEMDVALFLQRRQRL